MPEVVAKTDLREEWDQVGTMLGVGKDQNGAYVIEHAGFRLNVVLVGDVLFLCPTTTEFLVIGPSLSIPGLINIQPGLEPNTALFTFEAVPGWVSVLEVRADGLYYLCGPRPNSRPRCEAN